MAQRLPPQAPPAPPAACTFVRTQLDAYVDGELAPSDAGDLPLGQPVEAHLRDCARCAGEVQQLRALRAALRAVGEREEATLRASDELRRRAADILASP